MLSIVLTVASGLALAPKALASAPNAPACPADLTLLDSTLIETLNHTAELLFDLRNLNEGEASAVAFRARAHEKLQSLETLVLDPKARAAVKIYLASKIRDLETAHQGEHALKKEEETKGRENEALLLGTYQSPENLSSLIKENDILQTEVVGNHVITIHDPDVSESNFSFRNLVTIHDLHDASSRTLKVSVGEPFRNIHTPGSFGNLNGTKYLPKKGEIYFTTPSGIFSINVAEVLSGKSEEVKAKVILENNQENSKRMTEHLNAVRPGKRESPSRFFRVPKISESGRLIAMTQGSDIVVYDTEMNTFVVMRIPERRLNTNLEAAEWDLSPNGKYIAVASIGGDEEKISIYSTTTGRLINSLPYTTFAVAFSHDSRWLASNDYRKKVVIREIFGKKRVKEMDYAGDPKITQDEFIGHFFFSPDDATLFTDGDLGFQVWSAVDGGLKQNLGLQKIFKLGFNEEKNTLATFNFDNHEHTRDLILWKLKR